MGEELTMWTELQNFKALIMMMMMITSASNDCHLMLFTITSTSNNCHLVLSTFTSTSNNCRLVLIIINGTNNSHSVNYYYLCYIQSMYFLVMKTICFSSRKAALTINLSVIQFYNYKAKMFHHSKHYIITFININEVYYK